MNEVTLVNRSYQLIRKDLGLEEKLEIGEGNSTFDWLVMYLEKQINYLLDHDFNRLINSMYRIDIPDHRVNELLHSSKQGELALNIAKAIVEREKQKVLTRMNYQ
ncbi:MAG: hypothetical protein AB8B73_03210 [Ekhidna sp.]